jgi:hypothetical protein
LWFQAFAIIRMFRRNFMVVIEHGRFGVSEIEEVKSARTVIANPPVVARPTQLRWRELAKAIAGAYEFRWDATKLLRRWVDPT